MFLPQAHVRPLWTLVGARPAHVRAWLADVGARLPDVRCRRAVVRPVRAVVRRELADVRQGLADVCQELAYGHFEPEQAQIGSFEPTAARR